MNIGQRLVCAVTKTGCAARLRVTGNMEYSKAKKYQNALMNNFRGDGRLGEDNPQC